MSVTEITVPCSTSNLGASFDTCGLALSLYLRIKVEPQSAGFQIELTGEGAGVIPCDEANFIIQVQNLMLPNPGQYDFEIRVDDEEIGVLPIAVEQVPPNPQV